MNMATILVMFSVLFMTGCNDVAPPNNNKYNTHNEWISEVDFKYLEQAPFLYSKILVAKHLISKTKEGGRKYFLREAEDVLDSILKEEPKFAPVYVQLARLTSSRGNIGGNRISEDPLLKQVSYLKQALILEPDYDYALAMMGYTMMYQGKLIDAEKYYQMANDLGSKYPYLKSQMAQLSIRRGEYRNAIKLALQGLEDNKSDPDISAGIINELIYAYEKLEGNHNAELEKWHIQRNKLAPEVPGYLADYARFRLHSKGDYETAIEYGEKALEITNFKFPEARLDLATAYYVKWDALRASGANEVQVENAFKKAISTWHPS